MIDPERRSERSPVKIYPWSMSATGEFEQDQLTILQHSDIGFLVEWLNEKPYGIMNSLIEIMYHGNVRRAIQIARGLVETNPIHQARFREVLGFGEDERLFDYWFKKPIEEIPSQPSEMTVPIEYVQ